jgi:CHAT domain-containing protein/tetratricopeptide (TPR) repeat protein
MPADLLVARLTKRIRDAEEGRPAGVLDERAPKEAQSLLRHAAMTGLDGERALLVAARLHWARYLAGRSEDLTVADDLFRRAEQEYDHPIPNHVRAAIQAGRERGDGPSLADSSRAVLAMALADGGEAKVQEVLGILRRTIELLHDEHPDRAPVQGVLLDGLLRRYQRLRNRSDLDEAISAGRAALPRLPGTGKDLVMCLGNLGIALNLRFAYRGAPGDLDDAVDLIERSIAAMTPEDNLLHMAYAGLSLALNSRFTMGRDLGDLTRAVQAMAAAVELCPEDDERLPELLSGYCNVLLGRYQATNDAGDLDQALAVADRLVARTESGVEPPNHRILGNLANVYVAEAQRSGDVAALRNAIALERRALDGLADDSPDRPLHLASLGTALLRLYNAEGDGTAIDQAVELLRTCVAEMSPHDPRLGPEVANFATVLHAQYERTGDPSHLDEALAMLRRAPRTQTLLAQVASARSNILLERYHLRGIGTDLDEAIAEAERYATSLPPRDRHRPGALANLAYALASRFARIGDRGDLDRAIALASEAMDADRRAEIVTCYSNLLLRRFDIDEDPSDLREVLILAIRTLRAMPPRGSRSSIRVVISNLLRKRFEADGHDHHLEASIRMAERVLSSDEQLGASRPLVESNLAVLLRFRYARHGRRDDATRALGLWDSVARSTAAPAPARVGAAKNRAELLGETQGPAAALDAYATAVNDLLPLLTWRGSRRSDHYRNLRDVGSLGSDAAACAIAAGNLRLAVELLELGRGLLWSQVLDTRGDLSAVRAVAPELADELEKCRAVLDGEIDSYVDIKIGAAARAPSRQAAAERFEDLVRRVRELVPSADFLRPLSFDKLAAGDEGPVAIVNISRWRCDVLLVRNGTVRLVELPEVTLEEAAEVANRYLDALQTFDDSDGAPASGAELDAVLTSTLEWLQDHVVDRTLEASGAPGRLWWCPTGPLMLLPLHAAQRHEPVAERVVTSYTPTLRSLHFARSRPAEDRSGRFLVVAIPRTPGLADLPGAVAEARVIAEALPGGEPTELIGSAAGRDAILRNLRDHSWLHAGCHATQALDDPEGAGLIPYDWAEAGVITVADLLTVGHTDGDLAFVSACKTATSVVTHLDESYTIAATMSHGGWRHVIGTLWSVNDRAALRICREFYPRLAGEDGQWDAGRAAFALHEAVQRLRRAYPRHPSMWAPFVHTGP